MKISVLIAAYQADRFIRTALASVRAQSHPDWEIVVVEDGSHDGTEALVRTFARTCAQSVTYANLGRNLGVAAARNRLLDLATGAAVAFLDADDTWAHGHLAAAVAHLAAGAPFVVGGVRVFDLATNRLLENYGVPPELPAQPLPTLFRRSAILTSSCVVLSRSLVERVGRFDPEFRIGEDRDYWLRCALAGAQFRGTKGFTCNYAKHDASSMTRTRLVAAQSVRFYEKHRACPGVPARLRRHLLAQSLIAHGRLQRAHDLRGSATSLLRAWRCEPFDARIPCHLAFTGWRSLAPAPRRPPRHPVAAASRHA